jgi:molybdopterin-biosynthesis enzyme MoeA-like protein
VFTSGGVGPTHDDVTMEGVARGLTRRVIRHPRSRVASARSTRRRSTSAAQAVGGPGGHELIVDGRLGFPTIKCENVYILPGIPEILEQKFNAIRERFAASPYFLRVVYTTEGEGAIAAHLNATLAAFPELLLGSYPKIGDPSMR